MCIRHPHKWLVGLCLVISACGPTRVSDAVALTKTEPHFVVTNSTPDKRVETAIVFVHGIFGDIVDTWKNSSGVGFFDLVEEDPEFKGRFDMFAFGYSSHYFSDGSYRVREAAKRLKLQYDAYLANYKRVIFVVHSMGGLVAMRFLIANPHYARRVPVIVMFATPQDPTQVASIAKHVARNDALYELSGAKDNQFFVDLNDDWKGMSRRPVVDCAYEKEKTGPILVVSQLSAIRHCDGDSPTIPSDHIGIVKPSSRTSDAYAVLLRALRIHTANPPAPVSPYSDAELKAINEVEARIQHNVTRFPGEALKDAMKLATDYPKHPNAFRLIGTSHWNLGEFEAALGAAKQALDLDPLPDLKFKIEFNRVAALLALGRRVEAQPLLDKLVSQQPDDEVVRVLVALSKMQAGEFADAASHFGELANLPRLPGALPFARLGQGLSLALSSPSHDQAAASLIDEAVRLEPKAHAVFSDSPKVMMTEGWNYAVFREFATQLRDRADFMRFGNAAHQIARARDCR